MLDSLAAASAGGDKMEQAVLLFSAVVLLVVGWHRRVLIKKLALEEERLAATKPVIAWMQRRESSIQLERKDLMSRILARREAQLEKAQELVKQANLPEEESYRAGALQATVEALITLFNTENLLFNLKAYETEGFLDAVGRARGHLLERGEEIAQGKRLSWQGRAALLEMSAIPEMPARVAKKTA